MTTFWTDATFTSTGQLTDGDIDALYGIVGDTGTVVHDRQTQQVHLFWAIETDSMPLAMESARHTYEAAQNIIGVTFQAEPVGAVTVRYAQRPVTAPPGKEGCLA